MGIATLALLAGLASCAPDPADRSPERLYERYCARCHGAEGEGNPRLEKPNLDLRISTLLAESRDGERAEVTRRIAQGHESMPAFEKRLSPEEIDQLIDYLFRFQPAADPP